MKKIWKKCFRQTINFLYPTRRHGNFAGVHTLLRIILVAALYRNILVLRAGSVIQCQQIEESRIRDPDNQKSAIRDQPTRKSNP
jgi:hypothetical protein